MNNIFSFKICFCLSIVFLGCNTPEKESVASLESKAWQVNLYAENFALNSSSDSVFLKIKSPINNNDLHYALPKFDLNDIAISNSVQWAFLKRLIDDEALPKGIIGHKYFCDSNIHNAIKSGQSIELQGAENLDEELMIESKCKLLLQDGFNAKALSNNNKTYTEFFILEWKEKHPLARLEWIKVFGALIGQDEKAEKIFNEKVASYEKLKTEINKESINCFVMTSAPFKNEWHIPAKNSYMETLISDAGGTLLHNESNTHVSQNLSLEEAYIAFKNADVWLVNSGTESLQGLNSAVPFYKEIKAVNTGQVYNYHKSKAFGNYLFWEDAVCQPEQLLQEYHAMFSGNLENAIFYKHVE